MSLLDESDHNRAHHSKMKPFPKDAYGLLLTFDGYGANVRHCMDISRLYDFLYNLPAAIGMRRLGFPQVVLIEEKGIRGLSAFTFIMESHISIHTYEERGFVTADVYSCKEFDVDAVTQMLKSYFETQSFSTQTVVRGKEFNKLNPRQRKRLRTEK